MEPTRFPFGKFTGNPPIKGTKGVHTCPMTGKKSAYRIIDVDGNKFTIRFSDGGVQTRSWLGPLTGYVTTAFDWEGKYEPQERNNHG